jgi:glutamate-1-semialdehyde 2,1-aminomutase
MKHYATYSRSDDCFSSNCPQVFIKGSGCHVTSDDGREFIDFGMALRSVILGYCNPIVDEAVKKAIDKGVCFTRSNPYEGELKELLKSIIPCAEEVKLGKNGSDVTHAAVKLARAYTGRNLVLIAEENPFISTADFFIGTTLVNDGIPRDETVRKYSYNNMNVNDRPYNASEADWNDNYISLEEYVGQHNIAAIILDPSTIDINREKLQYIRDLCDKYGIIMILDEVISGFRYGMGGVQGLFGVKPDLCTLGKAMGNGYAVSALCGRKELFDLGLRDKGNVFLLSGTYFSNTPDIAAAIACVRELQEVPEYIWETGQDFSDRLRVTIHSAKMSPYMQINDWMPCNPLIVYETYDDKFALLELKTLFDQEMVKQGILMPYIAISASHTKKEIQQTVDAAEYALSVCKKAIDSGNVKESLCGHCEKPVFRKV